MADMALPHLNDHQIIPFMADKALHNQVYRDKLRSVVYGIPDPHLIPYDLLVEIEKDMARF